jgi:CRISPR/Cas system-associated exonuclease Cas4 (RecB family)
MKTFLQELAETVTKDYPDWDKLTVVFPNRRAALYFKNELRKNLTAPKWVPTILTIEEFISSFSDLQVADKFNLILRLYQSYKQVNANTEGIDKFYYWGEMLLRDFEELDKYLVHAEDLFRDVSNLKEVEQYFDYLTEEQKTFLQDFWQTVEFSSPETKARFLSLWKSLLPVYKHFVQQLLADGIGYEGLIHRKAWARVAAEKPGFYSNQIVFAGFYALTRVEEKIVSWFVQYQQAKVYWDEDDFYVSKDYREAGNFFRVYREHPILKETFSKQAPQHLSKERKITLLGVPQKAGQPKLLAQYLKELKPEDYEKTVVVLPDESMLLPVLYSLPSQLTAINVTMGYPLVQTPFFSFIDFLFDLHRTKRKNEFYFRHVFNLLNHPYLKSISAAQVGQLQELIKKGNRVHLNEDFFASGDAFIAAVFKNVAPENLCSHLLDLIEQLAVRPVGTLFEKEFAFHFHRQLAKLKELTEQEPMEIAMVQKLFRQMMRSEKVPFLGEPLKGIQVMGVLETRNLDFENVFVLSLNEGMWPASAKQGSYIPYSVRKAYGLPTYQHQDSMYAYLFYRILQRTQNASLFYNTEPDVLGMGEMSRYLNQIIYDTGWPFERKLLHSPVSIKQPQPISIPKDASVLDKLTRYEGQDLTPSSLNNYLDCRLLFYFKNVIGLKEPNEVEETADARVFGNIFHEVMHSFYSDLKSGKGQWLVEPKHFDNLKGKLDALIERAYRKHFSLTDKREVTYEGQQLVVNEMVKKMAIQVLERDQAYAPFTIELLEVNNFNTKFPLSANQSVSLGGKIDRVDRKANQVRIIDYKTGKDVNDFRSVASLFDRDDAKRNKAAFQAMMYAWVYARKISGTYVLQPGLMNRKDLFKNDFEYGLVIDGQRIDDAHRYLPEFEDHLLILLKEIFDSKKPFDQTEDLKRCEYCAFRGICSR